MVAFQVVFRADILAEDWPVRGSPGSTIYPRAPHVRHQPVDRVTNPLDGEGLQFPEGSGDVLDRQERERQQLPYEGIRVARCQVGRSEAQPQNHAVHALGLVKHAAAQDDTREDLS